MKHVLLAAIVCMSMPASAGIYKCKSADGTTTYSDTPCPSAVQMAPATKPDGGSRGLRKAEQQALKEIDKNTERKRKARKKAARKTLASRQESAKQCDHFLEEVAKIKAALRQGYSKSEGEKLKRRLKINRRNVLEHC